MDKSRLSHKAILSLAVLKTNYDNREIGGVRIGYIENFVLLCLHLVRDRDIKEIDLSNLDEFCELFKDMYGLLIPQIIMRTILSRGKKLKFFKASNGSFYPDMETISKQLPLNSTPKNSIRQINSFKQNAKKFIEEKYKVQFSTDEIEDALIKLLSKHNIDFLYLISEESNLNSLLPSIDDKENLTEVNYALYKYIEHIEQNDPINFTTFENICMGYILLNSIMYSNDEVTDGTLKDVNVFLDTKLILRLIGIEGEVHKKNYQELINYIREKSNSLKLFIFDKHLDETLHILEKAKETVDNGNIENISQATRFFKEKGSSPSDIQSIIDTLEEKLESLSIEIYKDYSYGEESFQYQIDENELTKSIKERYNLKTEKSFRNHLTDSIDIDVVIIAEIIKLQKGHVARNFSQIKNILLTNNVALSLAVMEHEKEIYHRQTRFIPSCITDFFFFSQLWSQSNHAFEPGVDIKTMIAHTIHTFEPDKNLIKRYLKEVKKLFEDMELSSDEYTLLSSSQITDSILEEKTLGNYKKIDHKLPFEILEEINKKAYEQYSDEKTKHNLTKKAYTDSKSELNNIKTTVDFKITQCVNRTLKFCRVIIPLIWLGFFFISIVQYPNIDAIVYMTVTLLSFVGVSFWIEGKLLNFVKNHLILPRCSKPYKDINN